MKNFSWGIVGHQNITDFLETSFRNGKIAHAYLFYGPPHLGKTTVAQKFVSLLLGQNFSSGLVHPDIWWIRRKESEKKLAQNISIDQIRELEQKLSLSSFLNSYKIAIIEEAETLSREACDCLLKTLEEPTPKTVIILIARSASLLPETILSRCQTLKFLPVPQSEIYKFLISQKIEKKLALDLRDFALGRPGIIIELLKDFKNGSVSFFLKDYQEKVDGFVNIVNSTSFVQKLEVIDRLAPKTKEGSAIWKETLSVWSLVLRDLLLMKNNCEPLTSHSFFKEKLQAVLQKFSTAKILKLIEEIKKSQEYITLNINFKLILENLILQF